MKNAFSSICKYLRYYPDASLWVVYRIESKTKNGCLAITYTKDKKIARRFKYNKTVKVQRMLMCRTLY